MDYDNDLLDQILANPKSTSEVGHMIIQLNKYLKKPTIEAGLSEILIVYLKYLHNAKVYMANGLCTINFAEAALLIQGASQLYAKKVDLLWDFMVDHQDRMLSYEEKNDQNADDFEKIAERKERFKRRRKKVEMLENQPVQPISSFPSITYEGAEKLNADNFDEYVNNTIDLDDENTLHCPFNESAEAELVEFLETFLTNDNNIDEYKQRLHNSFYNRRNSAKDDVFRDDMVEPIERQIDTNFIPRCKFQLTFINEDNEVEPLIDNSELAPGYEESRFSDKLLDLFLVKYQISFDRLCSVQDEYEAFYASCVSETYDHDDMTSKSRALFQKIHPHLSSESVAELATDCIESLKYKADEELESAPEVQPEVPAPIEETTEESEEHDQEVTNILDSPPAPVTCERRQTLDGQSDAESGFFEQSDLEHSIRSRSETSLLLTPSLTSPMPENGSRPPTSDLQTPLSPTNMPLGASTPEKVDRQTIMSPNEISLEGGMLNISQDSGFGDHSYCETSHSLDDYDDDGNEPVFMGFEAETDTLNPYDELLKDGPACFGFERQSGVINPFKDVVSKQKRLITKLEKRKLNHTESSDEANGAKKPRMRRIKVTPILTTTFNRFERFYYDQYEPSLGEGVMIPPPFYSEQDHEEAVDSTEDPVTVAEAATSVLDDSADSVLDDTMDEGAESVTDDGREADKENLAPDEGQEKSAEVEFLKPMDPPKKKSQEEVPRSPFLEPISAQTEERAMNAETMELLKECFASSDNYLQWHHFIREKTMHQKEKDFNIHVEGDRIINELGTIGTERPFGELIRGSEPSDVCRSFISILQLANTENVELLNTNPGRLANDTFSLKLLSTEKHHETLDEFVSPSTSEYSSKMENVKKSMRCNKLFNEAVVIVKRVNIVVGGSNNYGRKFKKQRFV